MRGITIDLVVPLGLLAISQGAIAQALEYYDCEVEDPPSLVAAITQFYDAMEGGARPNIFLDSWIWNGENTSTHRIIVAYPDYAAQEAFRTRAGGSAALGMLFNSIDAVADCESEGLAVFRGAWGGNPQTPTPYFAVFGVSTTDGAAYTAALEQLAESQVGSSPGAIILFENRAGIAGDTHLVAVAAPTLAALNQYLDTLFASDDFADFNEEVSSIRTLTWRNQAFRMRVWATPAPGN